MALVVGTAASLAANVAVGGADPIGKALTGWPALSMLVSVKLLFAMIEHHAEDDQRTVEDDQQTSGTVRQAGGDEEAPSGTVPIEGTATPAPSATDRPADPASGQEGTPGDAAPARTGDRAGPFDVCTVAHLIPAARVARAALATEGRSLSRDNLADAMRDQGRGVFNERASLLLKILKAEQDVASIDPPSGPLRAADMDLLSEVVN